MAPRAFREQPEGQATARQGGARPDPVGILSLTELGRPLEGFKQCLNQKTYLKERSVWRLLENRVEGGLEWRRTGGEGGLE